MSLAERLAIRSHGTPCKFARRLDEARLDEPDEVDQIERMLGDGTLKPTTAARLLTIEGYRVSDSVAQRHVRGECSCA